MIEYSDFGAIAQQARICTIAKRVREIEAFMALCRLSELMDQILKLRTRCWTCPDWRAERTWTTICKQELECVNQLDVKLVQWKDSHRDLFAKSNHADLPRSVRFMIRILDIIHL